MYVIPLLRRLGKGHTVKDLTNKQANTQTDNDKNIISLLGGQQWIVRLLVNDLS